MLRVALIDDEPLARQRLRHLLKAHPGATIIGEAEDRDSAMKLLRREEIDAVFLDIEMPGASGFELLRDLERPPKAIIVTAHARHAIQAFEIEAIDCILKPVQSKRFAQAIRRIESACLPGGEGRTDPPYSADDRICLQTPQRTLVVRLSSIPLLQADGDFTRVFVKDSAPLMICKAIAHYEKLLPSPPFLRVDRSLIIHIEAIIRIDRKSRDEAVVFLEGIPESVTLGRAAQARIREALG